MKVGIQFYSFNPAIKAEGFDKALNFAARCGVDGVELFSMYDIPAIKYRKILNDAGVICHGSHNHLSPLLNDLDHVMEYNYTVGNKMILCHYLLPDERGTKDKWLFVADSLNKIATELKRNGFEFSYHNHAFEFEEVYDGECGLEILINNTDRHLVGFELHIGQLPKFGIDPVEYIKKVGRRVKLLHVHAFVDGGAPFDSSPAIKAARDLDVEWAVLENVYPTPTDFELVKKHVAQTRDAARGI